MAHREPAPPSPNFESFLKSAHCLDSYRGLIRFVRVDLHTSNYLKVLFNHQFQNADRAALEAAASQNYTIGGFPFNAQTALEKAKAIQSWLKSTLDRFLADPALRVEPDDFIIESHGKNGNVVRRRPYGPVWRNSKWQDTPAGFTDVDGHSGVADNDFQDYWYHVAASFTEAHRQNAAAPKCRRPELGRRSIHCRRCDRPVVGCADKHVGDPEGQRKCPGLRHLPFRPLAKCVRCGLHYFKKKSATCSRWCRNATYYETHKPRRTRKRPALPPLRSRRSRRHKMIKTVGARIAHPSS